VPPPLAAIALAPEGTRGWLGSAVEAGGGQIVAAADAEGLVWADPADPAGLDALLTTHPNLGWIQLPWAGVEPYAGVIAAHADRTWACAKGVYAEPVAEHALALALAGLRQVGSYARADRWGSPAGINLLGARVTIVGGGGITTSLLRLLRPFGCEVTVVRRNVAMARAVSSQAAIAAARAPSSTR
jgi:phosphoglycerate dehydrogenase-like enzyme